MLTWFLQNLTYNLHSQAACLWSLWRGRRCGQARATWTSFTSSGGTSGTSSPDTCRYSRWMTKQALKYTYIHIDNLENCRYLRKVVVIFDWRKLCAYLGQRVFLRAEYPWPGHHRASGEQTAPRPRHWRGGLHSQVRIIFEKYLMFSQHDLCCGRCLDKDPARRWSCDQLLSHNYFKNFSFKMPETEGEEVGRRNGGFNSGGMLLPHLPHHGGSQNGSPDIRSQQFVNLPFLVSELGDCVDFF